MRVHEDSVTLMDVLFVLRTLKHLIPLTSTRRGPRLRLRTSSRLGFRPRGPHSYNKTNLIQVGFATRGSTRTRTSADGFGDRCSTTKL